VYKLFVGKYFNKIRIVPRIQEGKWIWIDIVTRLQAVRLKNFYSIPGQEEEVFLFRKTSRPAVTVTHPPIQNFQTSCDGHPSSYSKRPDQLWRSPILLFKTSRPAATVTHPPIQNVQTSCDGHPSSYSKRPAQLWRSPILLFKTYRAHRLQG
jgi:hypothetical protein